MYTRPENEPGMPVYEVQLQTTKSEVLVGHLTVLIKKVIEERRPANRNRKAIIHESYIRNIPAQGMLGFVI